MNKPKYWQKIAKLNDMEYDDVCIATKCNRNRHLLVDSVLSYENIKNVLELGCANGSALKWFRKKFPAKKFTGTDIFKPNSHGFKFVKISNDCKINEAKNASIDLVYSFGSLFYSNNLDASLEELNRILKIRKYVVCDMYKHHIDNLYRYIRFNLRKRNKETYSMRYGNIYTMKVLRKKFKNAGFEIYTEKKFRGSVVFLLKKIKNIRGKL